MFYTYTNKNVCFFYFVLDLITFITSLCSNYSNCLHNSDASIKTESPSRYSVIFICCWIGKRTPFWMDSLTVFLAPEHVLKCSEFSVKINYEIPHTLFGVFRAMIMQREVVVRSGLFEQILYSVRLANQRCFVIYRTCFSGYLWTK